MISTVSWKSVTAPWKIEGFCVSNRSHRHQKKIKKVKYYLLESLWSHTQMAERKAVIKNADMAEDMQQDAVDCASQALEKYNIEKVRKINSH